MKQRPQFRTIATVAFLSLFLAACSGTDTKEQEAAAAEAAAELRRLEDAARMAGNVVYFEFDSSALTEAGRAILDKQVALLKKTGASVRLEGHTDERGTREYNIALGERRANAVRDYMMVNGVPGSRLESISYGEEKPVSYGSSEVSWSQNRRVEIK
jgi:peptidoglycan-associated lipoprotein